jgi:hypothetical protein
MGEIVGDAMVAAALIDRLVHHATMVALKSYQLKERGVGIAPGRSGSVATRLRLSGATSRVVHFSAPDGGALFGAP